MTRDKICDEYVTLQIVSAMTRVRMLTTSAGSGRPAGAASVCPQVTENRARNEPSRRFLLRESSFSALIWGVAREADNVTRDRLRL